VSLVSLPEVVTSDDEDEEPEPDDSAVSFGVVEQAAKKNTKVAPVNNFIIIQSPDQISLINLYFNYHLFY
jgi:hypothetical protein